MQRDVNLKLVYIILILLLALGGITIFYQIKYEELKSDYEASFDAMNSTINDLTGRQKDLYANLSGLNVSANREYVLASRLEKKNQELENISRELARVQQELFEYQQNYDYLSVNYTIASDILTRNMATVDEMQAKIDTLKYDVQNSASRDILLQDIQQVQNELNRLKSY